MKRVNESVPILRLPGPPHRLAASRGAVPRPLPLALALALGALSLACGGRSGQPQLTPPPTAVVSPVPAGTPVNLALADKLYHDGDFEDAIAIYSAAALRGGDEQRQRALWSLASIQYDRGDSKAAEQALEALLTLNLAPEEEARAYLLLGLARFSQGSAALAQETLSQYIDMGGPAAPYARLRLAELANRRGDPSTAIREVETALAQALPPPVDTEARFALARYQDSADDSLSAIATYRELARKAATALDRGEALWRLAKLSRRVGDAQRYQESLYSLATRYPSHPRALEALEQPPLAASPLLSTVGRAVVLFRQRLNEQAFAAFRASLAEQPGPEGAALAHYHLGILAERAGDPVSALAEYEAAQTALQADPTNDLAVRASWERALVLESLGRLDDAAEAYAALAETSPLGEQATEALFRAGLARFRQARMTDAILFWGRYLDSAPGPAAEARAFFWLGRAAAVVGDADSAAQHFSSAGSVAPRDYYGLRARALSDGIDRLQDSHAAVRPPAPNWSRVEDWLRSWAGVEDLLIRLAFFDGAAWLRALELARTGLQAEAENEFAELLNQAAGDPWLLYRLARALSEEGQVAMAARAAARLAQGEPDPPLDILTLAYPAEYLDLATEAANDMGLSPLLLLALVRQESFFDPDALSSASAMGLTQVIPSTAREIAGQLDEVSFRESDLFRPRVSLRFGAYYLGSQLQLFDGDLWAALAAYNGGPASALRWWEGAPDDPDLFLEVIDFSQTHDYVRLVLENYAFYRYTYGLEDHPALPLP